MSSDLREPVRQYSDEDWLALVVGIKWALVLAAPFWAVVVGVLVWRYVR